MFSMIRMSRIGVALSACERYTWVLSLSNLINLSITLIRSQNKAARTREKALPLYILSRVFLFC